MEKWGDAEISINRWLSVICRVMKTFPCRKSFSFLTTSLGRRTQQIPSLCLFNINRKNKRRLENGSRRKHMAKASFCQSQQHEKKHIWKNTDTRLQPDLFSLLHLNSRNFMNGKCQGIAFPKPLWPASHELTMLFWWVHAVWSHRRDGTPTATLHHAVWLLTDNLIHSSLTVWGWNIRNQDSNNKRSVDWSPVFEDNNILD